MATIDLTNEDESSVGDRPMFSYTRLGKPKAMPRSRHYNRGFFNAKKADLLDLRRAISDAHPCLKNGPMFPKGTPVKVVIKCYLKRPESDFKNGTRASLILKKAAAVMPWAPIIPDVDNLAKFVMDALNKLVYHDDKQVVVLEVQKRRDNMGECMGHTTIEVMEIL